MTKKQTDMTKKQKIKFQQDFFDKAGKNLHAVKQMMDILPNTCFYIKDLEGRIVSFNRRNCEVSNLKDEFEAIGFRSDELFPEVKSKVYVSMDQQVVSTGRPLHNITHSHPVDGSMRLSHKSVYPVYSADGLDLIGTVCIYWQENEPAPTLDWHGRIKKITGYINQHFADNLTIARLARLANTSPSKLVRAFEKILGQTPANYLLNVRLNAARKLLETSDKTIVGIALECGFCDHSHFIRVFRKERDMSPGEYRKRHHSISSPKPRQGPPRTTTPMI